jgi:transposase-like protein
MRSSRPPLFRNRQFEPVIIVTCVRWYWRFSLSLRGLEELTAERGLAMDHTTIFRWDPSVRTRGASAAAGQLKLKSSTWHVDETFVRIAARWLYLFLAVDSRCQTVDVYLSETREREAAKCFLRKAMEDPGNLRHACSHEMVYEAIPPRSATCRVKADCGCRHRTRRYANNRIESDHRSIKRLRAIEGPLTILTARTLIQSLEAVHMIRKGQVLGITRKNLHGQRGSSARC